MLVRILSMVAAGLFAMGCAASSQEPEDAESGESVSDLSAIPNPALPGFLEAMKWFEWLEQNEPATYTTSSRSETDSHPWGGGFDPRRDPIFAHNEIEIPGVTPRAALALLQAGRSYTYYPNSSAATDCRTHEQVTLTLGREYCWTTFGNEQHMKIVELADGTNESVIAWQGGTFGVEVYHRWIMRKTPTGTKVITEEIERGLLPNLGVYNKKMNPGLHAGHEIWLRGMRDVLTRAAR